MSLLGTLRKLVRYQSDIVREAIELTASIHPDSNIGIKIRKIMHIRRIEKIDLENLSELYVAVFNHEPWSENWTKDWAYERLSIIFRSHRFYGFMAEEGNIPVGAIFSRVGSYKGELELEIVENFVSSTEQRKGVGAALMNELKSRTEKEGIVCFVLQTDKNTFAKDFYLKYGFQGHEENLLMSHTF
jgi:aminoglycoside 6'-N-acetyltransferase I